MLLPSKKSAHAELRAILECREPFEIDEPSRLLITAGVSRRSKAAALGRCWHAHHEEATEALTSTPPACRPPTKRISPTTVSRGECIITVYARCSTAPHRRQKPPVTEFSIIALTNELDRLETHAHKHVGLLGVCHALATSGAFEHIRGTRFKARQQRANSL
jgi:hypothetical protein